MQRFLRNQGSVGRSGGDARKQLIRREMRFVLQQDVRRFTKQLMARLLDEGCNLHPALARIRFYKSFMHRLTAGLPADAPIRFCDNTPQVVTGDNHPRFHAAVKYFLTHLSDAETQMTVAVLDVIEALKLDWQHTAEKCLLSGNPEEPYLQNLVEQISCANSDGNLAQHGLAKLRHRLQIAVVTSLLRHVRRTDLLREKFGSVPQILRGLSHVPTLFPALMATLKKQIPYAQHVIAQSFWRTLNNMDTEIQNY